MMNIYGLFVLLVGLLNVRTVFMENEYFPGLRKPPQSLNWHSDTAENAIFFAEVENIIEEQSRRRANQQWQQKQQQQRLFRHQKYPTEVEADGFTYRLPVTKSNPTDEIPFAIRPNDPRFYDKLEMGNAPASIYKNTLKMDDETIRSPVDGIPTYNVKAPMEINPKITVADDGLSELKPASKSKDVITRDDLKKLMESLHKSNQEEAIVNAIHGDVLKKRVDANPAVGMYVIALIAGISAAVTVGLLAIGIGWYTLQKKAKAAADVEYPAYGITGPNRDASPSGDRRLAHSAHMYHYQHQKQQIIAMENQANNERNGALSDVETDEENEEGDYTVYECPGLAPTGEMEVKNPMFLDDPTPIVKGTNPQKESQSQKPPAVSANTTTTTTSTSTSNTSTTTAATKDKK